MLLPMFCDNAYWKLSGTAPNNGTTGSYSVVGGNQGSALAYQYMSAIYELVQRNKSQRTLSSPPSSPTYLI